MWPSQNIWTLSKLCSVPWLVKSHWCKGYQKPGLQNWPFVSFSSWPQHLPHKDNSCYVQVKTNQLFLVPIQKEDLQCNHILILNQINLCICQPNYQSGCSPNAKRNANLCFWESGTNFLINQIFWQKITKVLIRCSSHVFTNSEFSYYYKYLNIEVSIFKIFTNSKFWEKKSEFLDSWKHVTSSLKFIYSEKATKFCEISTLLLAYVLPVKSKVEILQNFVAFSE